MVVDLKLLSKILKTKGIRVELHDKGPLFAGGSFDVPAKEVIEKLFWYQTFSDPKITNGFEVYQKVRVISHTMKEMIGKELYVIGWNPYPDYIHVLLSYDPVPKHNFSPLYVVHPEDIEPV